MFSFIEHAGWIGYQKKRDIMIMNEESGTQVKFMIQTE